MPVKILELKTFTPDEWLALDKQTLKDQLEILEGTSKNSMRLGPVRVCCPDGMILGD